MRPKVWVIVAGVGMTVSLSLAFLFDRRGFFLPGRTSDGHHVIERSCNACHVAFAAVPNKNCAGCHQAEMREDTHPIQLFDDPRWAEMLRKVNALQCVNCHGEHKIAARGVTVAQEFCYPCHDDVTAKRQSHRDLKPASCWDGGCHNYHDNTTLNISFLKKRLGQNVPAPPGSVLQRAILAQSAEIPMPDGPPWPSNDAGLIRAWQASVHARRAVNCSDCHGSEGEFNSSPGNAACARCHGYEIESFKYGKHGTRSNLKLGALTPAEARRPMNTQAAERALTCGACHDPHSADTRKASVEACLGCHDDSHSRNFKGSKHEMLFAAETHSSPSETAVTCATCHMPRTRIGDAKTGRVAVNHNNSWTLLPRDRMVKEVCVACHRLDFSLNSIFDENLVRNNFQGAPRSEHGTVKMAREEMSSKTAQEVSGK